MDPAALMDAAEKSGLDARSAAILVIELTILLGSEAGSLAMEGILVALAKARGHTLVLREGGFDGESFQEPLTSKPLSESTDTGRDMLFAAIHESCGIDKETLLNLRDVCISVLVDERGITAFSAAVAALAEARGHRVVFGDFGGYSGARKGLGDA